MRRLILFASRGLSGVLFFLGFAGVGIVSMFIPGVIAMIAAGPLPE